MSVADLLSVHNLITFLALTGLEIILGIDNVVFIAILAAKVKRHEQERARRFGLAIAMVSRILLLLAIGWVMKLTAPLISFRDHDISGRDLILLIGGLFLVAKATYEIHDKVEGSTEHEQHDRPPSSFGSVMMQIIPLNVVFSLDSVITAIGMTSQLAVMTAMVIMVTAIIVATGVMVIFAGTISHFVERHPTMKMLALSFLLLIGVMLVAEGFDKHIPKGYIYFAMAFSLGVEMLNIRVRKRSEPVKLHQTYVAEPEDSRIPV